MKKVIKSFFHLLVRMRSPVQIWIAVPQNPLFSFENGGFLLLSALFLLLEILWFGFDHITSHRQKKLAHRDDPGGPWIISACLGVCLQPPLFHADLRFHLGYQLRQQFFAFLLAVGIDVAGVLFTVRPDVLLF